MRMQNTWAIAMCYVPWQKWGDCMTLAKPLNVELYFLYYPNLLQEAEYE